MKQLQAVYFFTQVNGKKIRWTGWAQGKYFVPDSLITVGGTQSPPTIKMLGTVYNPSEKSTVMKYPIANGFLPYDDLNKWELVDGALELAETTKAISNKCACNIRDLMLQGCKCGGK